MAIVVVLVAVSVTWQCQSLMSLLRTVSLARLVEVTKLMFVAVAQARVRAA